MEVKVAHILLTQLIQLIVYILIFLFGYFKMSMVLRKVKNIKIALR